jgi:DNA mismatch repair protein MutS2
MQPTYPSNFEEKIGFDRIRSQVSEMCLCPLGKKKAAEAEFLTDFNAITRLIEQTSEMKTICQMEDSFPVDGYADATPFLERIQREGSWLDETELFTLRRSLDAIKSLISFFKRGDKPKYPYLTELAKSIEYFPFVSERIDAILNRFGKVKDNASPELARIRGEIASKQASVSKRINAILKSAQADGIVEKDAQTSIRDGRIVIPVIAANKRKLKGFIHDESATGKTFFIEPVEVVEINNEIKELEYDERREVIRILVEFSDTIRPYLPELLKSYDFLGDIDFIRAKGKFAADVTGAKPILHDTPKIYLRKAVHPVLMIALRREGKEVVPLDMELSGDDHILLISGPNAGGKSVCLKTVGVAQYMLQCGFLPPVLENSEMGIFRKLFIDIGDEQSIENDLSTYSSHLLNMKFFVKNCDSNTLILIDEFGAGTEPQVGGAIAESILQQFNEVGAFGIITTHYTNLKHFAAGNKGVINGAMLFDVGRIEPLFKFEIGKPGSSFAFEIARKIGLPEGLLKIAENKAGKDYMSSEKFLKEISRDKRYWEKKRESIRIAGKKSEEYEKKLENEWESIKSERNEILKKAKEEAEAILSQSNKLIENTIREIKESAAAKERTLKVRKEVEGFKLELKQNDFKENATIERKMEKIRERQKRNEEKRLKRGEVKPQQMEQGEKPKSLEKGDKVKIKDQDAMGEIMEINPKSAIVAFGSMLTTVSLQKLERVSDYTKNDRIVRTPQTGVSYDLQQRRLNFKSEIDIRGFRTDEAIEAVQELVDDAVMIGISRVRILHGKGNGILRQQIRTFLKTIPFVKSFADEHVEFGGSGITVVDIDS